MRGALAVLLVGLAAASPVNYCGVKMCGHGNTHTFCQYPPGPSPKCIGYMDARLTAEEKARVLARLNRRRSEAASGMLRNAPTAGNMLKLRWVEELARLAQRWADQCRPPSTPDERDSCRDLLSVGQCVASVVGEAPGLRVETMVDLWYMQSMLYKENITSYVVPMSNVNYYGDFAQMIWARSYMVGCGRSRFMSEWHGRLRTVERLVCNLSPRGPTAGRPLWSPAPPAAACPPRTMQDRQLPALCNYQADLDVSSDIDGAMTIEEHLLLNTVLDIESKESLNYLGSLDEIYLTKLAIVTMENTVTKALSYYNPIHKRDIIETLGLDYDLNNIDSNVVNKEIWPNNNATIGPQYKEKVTVTPKVIIKRVKIIGRPKSYSIQDLTYVGGEQITTEHANVPENVEQDHFRIDPDLYIDGVMTDTEEMNTTLKTKTSTLLAVNTLTHSETKISYSTEYKGVTTNFKESIDKKKTEENNIVLNTTDYIHGRFTTSNSITTGYVNSSEVLSTKIDDDYLTDPETVRELQEALERMERSLGEAPRQTPGKVRRELRDSYPNEEADLINSSNSTQDAGEDVQNLKDRAPMLNMVLKYMPYLKPYESELLGTASSATSLFEANMLCWVSVPLTWFRL